MARALRARGLRTGDHLAVLVANEPAFFEALWAQLRRDGQWHPGDGQARSRQ